MIATYVAEGCHGHPHTCVVGFPHTSTIDITDLIESRFVVKDNLVPFRCSRILSCVIPLQMETLGLGVICDTCNGLQRHYMFFSQVPCEAL
ncbi:hypothetical protein TNCV_3518191 [Trichonephila clavipes]|nr:hypothetical protein TNCV_3518191 [Trichonephila clavipes]